MATSATRFPIYTSKLTQAVGTSLEQFEGAELNGNQTACLQTYVQDEVSDEEIERSVLEGETSFAYDALRECAGDGSDSRAIVSLASGQLEAEGFPKELATCIARAGAAALKGVALEELATDEQANRRYAAAIQKGGKRCVGNLTG